MWITIASSVLTCVIPVICQFTECHHDPIYQVEEDGPLNEMQFKWLGSLQYIHIKNGTPHYFRVPRVILIHRLFVMSTAVDAAQVPEGYALGNVAFSEYERDEHECGVTIYDLSLGATCESAVLLVPLADVLLHPEYKHFGVTESIAILKLLVPIKSGNRDYGNEFQFRDPITIKIYETYCSAVNCNKAKLIDFSGAFYRLQKQITY